jgi:hypothetical protein
MFIEQDRRPCCSYTKYFTLSETRKDVPMDNRLDKLFLQVQKPARYTGGELNSVYKDRDKVNIRFAFCFPDVYGKDQIVSLEDLINPILTMATSRVWRNSCKIRVGKTSNRRSYNQRETSISLSLQLSKKSRRKGCAFLRGNGKMERFWSEGYWKWWIRKA